MPIIYHQQQALWVLFRCIQEYQIYTSPLPPIPMAAHEAMLLIVVPHMFPLCPVSSSLLLYSLLALHAGLNFIVEFLMIPTNGSGGSSFILQP